MFLPLLQQLCILFQFHDGSIKGFAITGSILRLELFQFHDGSIKGKQAVPCRADRLCFNSTMVRLKESLPQQIAFLPLLFQFHDGSIKGQDKLI